MNIWVILGKHFNGMKRIYDEDKVAVKYALAVFGHMGPLFTVSCGPMLSKDNNNFPLRRCYYNFTVFGRVRDARKWEESRESGKAYIEKELVLI